MHEHVNTCKTHTHTHMDTLHANTKQVRAYLHRHKGAPHIHVREPLMREMKDSIHKHTQASIDNWRRRRSVVVDHDWSDDEDDLKS